MFTSAQRFSVLILEKGSLGMRLQNWTVKGPCIETKNDDIYTAGIRNESAQPKLQNQNNFHSQSPVWATSSIHIPVSFPDHMQSL